ncbi:PcfJ domain-containing protein [Caminibacter pacificus]|uniref:PcfJ-like protein n=1 Tax=Caminibacter pacificus TaxID=1424653 RepID=A0AAJ4REB9_9BACT|nr:PcfJ domain-containing protein [Caminibacter pacificus]QCI28046.1 hypothetical protein C6V80_03450 [Caminibacter pacificus]ROR41247.1 PcfJ-like protein [Caminibacter pacificus]
MKSFDLTLPKSPAEIENHYFCECGNKFVDKNRCPKCGNQKFYTYEDVKKLNPKLYELKESNYGIECFIEYPVFNEKIMFKKERLAILINKEIKLSQKFREKFDFYYDEIATIVEKYLKFLGLWNERKRVFKLLKQLESRRVLEIIKVKDPEVLLWSVYDEDISVEEFFEKLLKDSSKSVKKAIYEKYKKQLYHLAYNPIIDILILRAVDDINYQRELISLSCEYDGVVSIDIESIEKFINFLRRFEQKEIVKFLKKAFEYNIFMFYIATFLNHPIKRYFKSIEDTLMNTIDYCEYEYSIPVKFKFDKFVFKLPKNSIELKNYGNELRNCLSMYTNVHNKRYLIFGVFKGRKLKYAVNFDKQKKFIVEAKGFANSNINEKDYKVIEKFFEEFKEAI